MKKQNFLIYALILCSLLGVFALWQYNLFRELSENSVSCGGDWTSNVKCPLGSYCRPLGKTPLVGGLCRPFLSSLFEIFIKNEPTIRPF